MHRRAVRRLTKAAAIGALLPLAAEALDRAVSERPAATNQSYPSPAEVAECARPLLAALDGFVRDRTTPVPSVERHPLTIGQTARVRAAIAATLELAEAARAKQAFDRHVVNAALCLMEAGVERVEATLLAAYAEHEAG